MPFRYSELCGAVSDAIDAVRSAIPKGFKFLKYKWIEFLKNKKNSPFKNLKRSIYVKIIIDLTEHKIFFIAHAKTSFNKKNNDIYENRLPVRSDNFYPADYGRDGLG
jgi:hypothetical protein